MKLAFLDAVDWDYDADTPYREPLGGTQSAAAYLAAELARSGVEVAFVNGTRSPHESRGVRFFGRSQATGAFFDSFDAVVVLSAPLGRFLRGDLGVKRPLVFWSGHAHTEAAVRTLAQPEERDAWSAFALLSEWQAAKYVERFAIDRARIAVLRHAASPAFIEQAAAQPWFESSAAPVLAYTSTPFRGLDVLLLAFPAIRKAMPQARLRVFSSMAVYRMEGGADRFGVLYEACRAIPGIEYIGAVPQRELAREMAGAATLAYPCTFPETGCIAAMEAMASGAHVVATQLAALPETTAGFATLVPVAGDRVDLAASFAAAVAHSLESARAEPAGARRRRDEQLAFARTEYTWATRARQWMDWIRAQGW